MNEKKTKILMSFPACGKRYYLEHKTDDLIVLDADYTEFKWMTRKRTEEELELKRIEWEKVPHLMSGEGYINQIRDEEIPVYNPDFPNNYVEYIKNHIGKVDYILLDNDLFGGNVLNALVAADVKPILIMPDDSLKEEYVGRTMLRGSKHVVSKMMMKSWNDWLCIFKKSIEEFALDYIELHHGRYLSDAIVYLENTHAQKESLKEFIDNLKKFADYNKTCAEEELEKCEAFSYKSGVKVGEIRSFKTVMELIDEYLKEDIVVCNQNVRKPLLTEDEIDCFNAYLEDWEDINFGNSDWCRIYYKIVGDRVSDYAKNLMDRYDPYI